ncbi:PREDICTED: probable disease resistance protein At5g45510 isoform X2 [Camelina sativa]|uniref:Probable disease resistance protein At5g45510 isoform X2 n=1 Tax=Camelina sativa TaxID=90675 RepID=A0ABM0X6S8_CAMSA|nr:PREDICTED: probable disease resistance protein At5g45510 isoform X2 [Camelina sativa]
MASSHSTYLEGVVDTACKEILNSLENDDVSRVILVGEAGIGKTWMARKIFERAPKDDSCSCYTSLSLNLNKDFDEVSLYEDIASQLSVFLDKEESEEDDSEDEEEDQNTRDLGRLKDKIHTKLRKKKEKAETKNLLKKKAKGERKKYLLLVLDDVGSVTNEEKVMKDLELEVFLAPFRPFKILLTRRKGEGDSKAKMKPHATDELHTTKSDREMQSDGSEELEVNSDEEMKSHATEEVHTKSDGEIDELEAESNKEVESHATDGEWDLLDPHSFDASKILCSFFTDRYLMNLLKSLIKYDLLESLEIGWFSKVDIVKMSMGLPAAVVVLAKSLNYISRNLQFSDQLPPKQKEVFLKVLSSFHPDRERANPILHLAYELLKTDDTVKSSIVDCFWHSLSFFEHCGCVYYHELIAHWILEGYFDPVRSVTKAYMEGHAVMMELLDRGFLKIHEDNVVMPEVAMKNLIDLRCRGLSSRSRIALAKVCGSDRTQGLGKTNQLDDIMEAVQTTRKRDKITTGLISGNRLRRESPEDFFEKLNDVEILGLFEPTVEPFVPFLSKLVKLRVLVIRDCDLLQNIEYLKALTKLTALEVSGASSLMEISDDFFKEMTDLQSLHLSGLQIKFAPSSISVLLHLHSLIIKDCPLLEDLPDIQELVELEVVDISGARGLQTCFDNTEGDKKNTSKNKNFYLLKKLQLLDFSESQIERLPMFQDNEVAAKLHSLTRLLLRNCCKLRRLPNLKPLSGLRILDLSGTSSLVKLLEVCFEDKKELRILNMSGTYLSELPTTIEELSSLNELLLRECINLYDIPNIQKLTNLEVIDVSGSTKLEMIEGSFEDMSYLREVNLFGTKVETPELPKETKIHCLKRIILADGRRFEGETWSKVKEEIEHDRSENASSSDAVATSQETPPEEIREIQSDEHCTEMGDASKERLLRVPIERDLYKKLLSRFASASQQEVMEINETNELDEDTLANAEFVSFVDCTPTRLTFIFNKTKSMKRCWLRMCTDIKDLFYDVDEEHLKSLETLSITNLASLETIRSVGNLENLKNLSLDCCPKIKTIFSEMPASLEVLNLKHCENLEKVVEGVQLSSLTNLTLKVENCPNLEEWEIIEPEEASSSQE